MTKEERKLKARMQAEKWEYKQRKSAIKELENNPPSDLNNIKDKIRRKVLSENDFTHVSDAGFTNWKGMVQDAYLLKTDKNMHHVIFNKYSFNGMYWLYIFTGDWKIKYNFGERMERRLGDSSVYPLGGSEQFIDFKFLRDSECMEYVFLYEYLIDYI